MNDNILSAIDAEIAKLQQARTLLAGLSASPAPTEAPRRGRPKGTKNAIETASAKKASAKAKRTLSEEARMKIAAAQKKRWAAKKKAD